MELDERLTNIEQRLDHIMNQNKGILELMIKFIDHVEEIEAIAVKTNVLKN